MLFCSYSKVNKLVLLRRELHPVFSRSLKTALVNLAKHSTVLLGALAVLLIYYRHFINKDFKLKSYLLAIKDLNYIHSGVYMLSVLLKALK
jgi:hypothetical protein